MVNARGEYWELEWSYWTKTCISILPMSINYILFKFSSENRNASNEFVRKLSASLCHRRSHGQLFGINCSPRVTHFNRTLFQTVQTLPMQERYPTMIRCFPLNPWRPWKQSGFDICRQRIQNGEAYNGNNKMPKVPHTKPCHENYGKKLNYVVRQFKT